MIRIAAIVVLAMLSHAAFMTRTVDAAEGLSESHVKSMIDSSPSLAEPVHELFCFTTQLAVKSAPMFTQLGDRAASLPDHVPGDIPPSREYTAPPHHPPDIFRALLQVYRI